MITPATVSRLLRLPGLIKLEPYSPLLYAKGMERLTGLCAIRPSGYNFDTYLTTDAILTFKLPHAKTMIKRAYFACKSAK